jgi:hypothetical protein
MLPELSPKRPTTFTYLAVILWSKTNVSMRVTHVGTAVIDLKNNVSPSLLT